MKKNILKIFKLEFPILLILFFAIGIRLWGIGFGLPQVHIGDEGALVYAALYSGSEFLKPLRFQYGALVPYILLLEYLIYYGINVLLGKFLVPFDLIVTFAKDPSILLLLGRWTMALFGVATIWLVYLVGKQFFNKRIGLLAAFFLAISFLHVKESHYLKEGNLAAFFALACFYFTLKILKKRNKWDYMGAGITLGLGIGTKFEPILMAPVVFMSHLLAHKKFTFHNLTYFFLGLIPSIVITFPYLLINPVAYHQKFLAEFKLTTTVYPLYLQGKPIWWWFFSTHIPQGLGIGLFVLAVIGFMISVVRAKRNHQYLFVPMLPIIFLTTIDFWQKYHNARYALLILPFFTLATGICLDLIFIRFRKKPLQIVFMTVAIISLSWTSFMRTVKFNTMLKKPDTRTIGKQWIEKNIPAGAKILIESMVRPEYPANINVPLTLSSARIDDYIKQAQFSGYPATYLSALKTAISDSVGYDLVATPRVDLVKDLMTDVSTPLTSAAYWVTQKVDYLVISGWHVKPDVSVNFQKTIDENYLLLKEFQPFPQFSHDPHFVQMDYQALDSIDIKSEKLVFGPSIFIYKSKRM